MRRHLAVVGPAGPEMVWDRYDDLDQWSRWAPLIGAVDAGARRLATGLTGVVHGPLGLRVGFRVDAVDAERRTWSWSVRSGPIRMRLEHQVLAHADGGSVATLDLEGAAPVVLGYLAPATLALRRLVAR